MAGGLSRFAQGKKPSSSSSAGSNNASSSTLGQAAVTLPPSDFDEMGEWGGDSYDAGGYENFDDSFDGGDFGYDSFGVGGNDTSAFQSESFDSDNISLPSLSSLKDVNTTTKPSAATTETTATSTPRTRTNTMEGTNEATGSTMATSKSTGTVASTFQAGTPTGGSVGLLGGLARRRAEDSSTGNRTNSTVQDTVETRPKEAPASVGPKRTVSFAMNDTTRIIPARGNRVVAVPSNVATTVRNSPPVPLFDQHGDTPATETTTAARDNDKDPASYSKTSSNSTSASGLSSAPGDVSYKSKNQPSFPAPPRRTTQSRVDTGGTEVAPPAETELTDGAPPKDTDTRAESAQDGHQLVFSGKADLSTSPFSFAENAAAATPSPVAFQSVIPGPPPSKTTTRHNIVPPTPSPILARSNNSPNEDSTTPQVVTPKTPSANRNPTSPEQTTTGLVTPDSRNPSADADTPPSIESFEDLHAQFQADLRDLDDYYNGHEEALLNMNVAFAVAFADTLEDEAELDELIMYLEEQVLEADAAIAAHQNNRL